MHKGHPRRVRWGAPLQRAVVTVTPTARMSLERGTAADRDEETNDFDLELYLSSLSQPAKYRAEVSFPLWKGTRSPPNRRETLSAGAERFPELRTARSVSPEALPATNSRRLTTWYKHS
jgi:hypothetical protein